MSAANSLLFSKHCYVTDLILDPLIEFVKIQFDTTHFVQINLATCCSVSKTFINQYQTKNRICHTGSPWTYKVTH